MAHYIQLTAGPGPEYFFSGVYKSIYMAELGKIELLYQLFFTDHRDRFRELAASGYEPRSVVTAWTADDTYFTISLWLKK